MIAGSKSSNLMDLKSGTPKGSFEAFINGFSRFFFSLISSFFFLAPSAG